IIVIAGVLHSSLTHEVLHGHPFNSAFVNALLVFPALIIFIPYLRFKYTHLDHHRDERLTDPYDDPETNFMDPQVWDQLPKWRQSLHQFNNTLLGRMFVGPILSQIAFMRADLRLILAGDRRVALGWFLHVPSLIVAYVMVVMVADVRIWLWVLAAYLSMAILKIRTYLEHRVHDHPRGRSVVVEDRGLLSFLFLNNNLHSVHHAHPSVPWYALPRLFASKRDRFLTMNDGYHFGCYGEVIRKFAINRKDPVAHPNWSQKTVD
ncbi:MAG: fatty acid desaturase, partial [Rhodobacteraceae bacterium]|nr:fatty acid desaturase [Paracoccaceae bacterium]